MKSQFQSSESLSIRLTPFISKTTGDYVMTGADICTLYIRKPDGTLHTGATVVASWDSISKTWSYVITSGSFMSGEWCTYAVSDDATCLPKWQVAYWGDYVDNIGGGEEIAAINTKLGTPAGSSFAADISSLDLKLGDPVGNSVSADIAAIATTTTTAAQAAQTAAGNASTAASGLAADMAIVKADATAAKTAAQAAQASSLSAAVDAAIIKKVNLGRWRIIGNQLVLYEMDGETEFKRFDLKDDIGNPSGTRVFERIPHA